MANGPILLESLPDPSNICADKGAVTKSLLLKDKYRGLNGESKEGSESHHGWLTNPGNDADRKPLEGDH